MVIGSIASARSEVIFPYDSVKKKVLDVRFGRAHLEVAMSISRTWSISRLGHQAPAALTCVRMGAKDQNTPVKVPSSYSKELGTEREAATR